MVTLLEKAYIVIFAGFDNRFNFIFKRAKIINRIGRINRNEKYHNSDAHD